MHPNKFQKALDKQRTSWYTNLKSKKMVSSEDLLLNEKVSLDIESSKQTDETIKAISEAIVKAGKKFPNLRLPVIAGGAIRDVVFGLKPRDYDIFFDLSSVPEDERDDHCLLMGSYITDELGTPVSLVKKQSDKGQDKNYEKAFGEGGFIVYETRYQSNWDQPPDANDTLQFIGHVDSGLTTDPLTFTDRKFDYPLVKCLYDPSTGEYSFSKEFVSCMNSRKITVTDTETLYRVDNFRGRYTMKTKAKCPFSIEDKRPKSDKKKSSYSDIISTQYYGMADVQRFQNFIVNARVAQFEGERMVRILD